MQLPTGWKAECISTEEVEEAVGFSDRFLGQ